MTNEYQAAAAKHAAAIVTPGHADREAAYVAASAAYRLIRESYTAGRIDADQYWAGRRIYLTAEAAYYGAR